MDDPPILWRVHLDRPPEDAFAMWATDAGRARFWAEESVATDGGFVLRFVNGQSLSVDIVEAVSPTIFAFRYFRGSTVRVRFAPDGAGGCDLELSEENVPPADRLENYAGWVSVLSALKAALDHGIDIRTHDPSRSWDQRYVIWPVRTRKAPERLCGIE